MPFAHVAVLAVILPEGEHRRRCAMGRESCVNETRAGGSGAPFLGPCRHVEGLGPPAGWSRQSAPDEVRVDAQWPASSRDVRHGAASAIDIQGPQGADGEMHGVAPDHRGRVARCVISSRLSHFGAIDADQPHPPELLRRQRVSIHCSRIHHRHYAGRERTLYDVLGALEIRAATDCGRDDHDEQPTQR